MAITKTLPVGPGWNSMTDWGIIPRHMGTDWRE
jgi:hypothetical protein